MWRRCFLLSVIGMFYDLMIANGVVTSGSLGLGAVMVVVRSSLAWYSARAAKKGYIA